ncbi:hypothetical protein KR009_006606 [Drosophila setifemur]|nr:hypothetical protein KR009_006606 [Drosophila setifemur]
MVLVSNEWPNKRDEDQKPSPTLPTPTPKVAGPTALTIGGVSVKTATTLSPDESRSTTGEGATSTGKGKKALNQVSMDTTNHNKSQQDTVFQLIEKENYGIETVNINSAEANENQENNNTQVCDSNTNTLQGASTQDRHTSSQVPVAISQQVLNMAMNSVLNANNTGVGIGAQAGRSLFNSLGGFNNGDLQRELAADCGTFLAASAPLTSAADVDIGPDAPLAVSTGEAKIVLQCEAKSHKFEQRSILLLPNQECKVGRLIAKSKASEGNAIFDCKVLSRNHAMLWYTSDGRFWVKDTKSSNGTFINDNKLGNDPSELRYGDTVKFGVEVIENSRQEVHGCIIARVTLFLPDGREAISIESDQLQLAGPNRISFDEIQRLNSFLQEAVQREKTLKAKLSSLQGVLDSTRKNSAMCWQSMITEDQLLHKITLLEKKLQMMEKNLPENALRNEIVKLLEDKTTYQLTAKEALRKVYQERCDAMQMLSKMELAYTSSENECSLLRAQILTSKQTLQDFNARLEQLQQEYLEYKQESLRQQQEAKEHEESRLELLNVQLNTQEREIEKLRLQQTIAKHDDEQNFLEQNVLDQLNAVIPDDDEYDDENHAKDGNDDEDSSDDNEEKILAVKQKKIKKSKLHELDLKNKVIRKSSVLRLLKNSDLSKGEGGSAVLKAIFNDMDKESEILLEEKKGKFDYPASGISYEVSPVIKPDEGQCASDEFMLNSPEHVRPKVITELTSPIKPLVHILQSLDNLVTDAGNPQMPVDLPAEQTIEMLQEECDTYKQMTTRLNADMSSMQEQIEELRQQLKQESAKHTNARPMEKQPEYIIDKFMQRKACQDESQEHSEAWNEDFAAINNPQVEIEEELVIYKEKLEQSESNNMQLRSEISQLRLKQQIPTGNQMLLHRVLPLGCIVLAALIYLISNNV